MLELFIGLGMLAAIGISGAKHSEKLNSVGMYRRECEGNLRSNSEYPNGDPFTMIEKYWMDWFQGGEKYFYRFTDYFLEPARHDKTLLLSLMQGMVDYELVTHGYKPHYYQPKTPENDLKASSSASYGYHAIFGFDVRKFDTLPFSEYQQKSGIGRAGASMWNYVKPEYFEEFIDEIIGVIPYGLNEDPVKLKTVQMEAVKRTQESGIVPSWERSIQNAMLCHLPNPVPYWYNK